MCLSSMFSYIILELVAVNYYNEFVLSCRWSWALSKAHGVGGGRGVVAVKTRVSADARKTIYTLSFTCRSQLISGMPLSVSSFFE